MVSVIFAFKTKNMYQGMEEYEKIMKDIYDFDNTTILELEELILFCTLLMSDDNLSQKELFQKANKFGEYYCAVSNTRFELNCFPSALEELVLSWFVEEDNGLYYVSKRHLKLKKHWMKLNGRKVE